MAEGEHDWVTIGVTEPDRKGRVNIQYRCSKCGRTTTCSPDSFPGLGGCRFLGWADARNS